MLKILNKPSKDLKKEKIIAYSTEHKPKNKKCLVNNCGSDGGGVNNFCGEDTNSKCIPPTGGDGNINSTCSSNPGINNICS